MSTCQYSSNGRECPHTYLTRPGRRCYSAATRGYRPHLAPFTHTNIAATFASVFTCINDRRCLGGHCYCKATRGHRPRLPLGLGPPPPCAPTRNLTSQHDYTYDFPYIHTNTAATLRSVLTRTVLAWADPATLKRHVGTSPL